MTEIPGTKTTNGETSSVLAFRGHLLQDGFAMVPHTVVRSKRLKPIPKLVLLFLLSAADNHNGRSSWGQQRIADDLGLSVDNVHLALACLNTLGIVTWQRRGQGKTNVYTIHQDGLERFIASDNTHQSAQATEGSPETAKTAGSLPQNPLPADSRIRSQRHKEEPVEEEPVEELPLISPKGGKGEKPQQIVAPPSQVPSFMKALEGEMGYVPQPYAANAKAAKSMLLHYSPGDILDCWRHLKDKPFWRDKAVTLMVVQREIGDWVSRGKPKGENGRGRYGEDRAGDGAPHSTRPPDRRGGVPSGWTPGPRPVS